MATAHEVPTREERVYNDACGRVEELLDRGYRLSRVEAFIDRRALDQDEREALKLWAWGWAASANDQPGAASGHQA